MFVMPKTILMDVYEKWQSKRIGCACTKFNLCIKINKKVKLIFMLENNAQSPLGVGEMRCNQ